MRGELVTLKQVKYSYCIFLQKKNSNNKFRCFIDSFVLSFFDTAQTEELINSIIKK